MTKRLVSPLADDRLSTAALVLANLVPLIGVILFDWDVAGLLVLYWLENLVVGAYTLVRMLSVGGLSALFTGAFFVLHYSAFCGVHGLFLVIFAGMGDPGSEVFGGSDGGPLIFLYILWGVIAFVAERAPDFFYLPLLGLAVSHGISLVQHHFIGREDDGRRSNEIMGDPYKRIAVLHLAIIAGGFAAMALGTPFWMLLALVALKIALDLYLHRRAHAQRRAVTAHRAMA